MNEIDKFLKECRALRLKGATEEQWEYAEKLGQACIYIDQLQAKERIEKMETKEICCKLDCRKPAEWEIYAEGVPDTVACTNHVGELLTDAQEHRIFRIKEDENGKNQNH